MINKKRMSAYSPYLLLLGVMILYHFFASVTFGDDAVYFSKVLDQQSLGHFLSLRYNTWSSRIFIEGVLVYIAKWDPVIWKVLDVLFVMLAAWSIRRITDITNDVFENTLVAGLILLYPFVQMSSAGWIATTMNYLWPLSLLLYSFSVIKKAICGQKFAWYEGVLSCAALLFGANQEQAMVIACCAIAGIGIYFVLKKTCHWLYFAYLGITVLNLGLMVFCPGNAERVAMETEKWLPAFAQATLWDKIYLGVTDTINLLSKRPNYMLILFLLLLCYFVIRKSKNVFVWLVALYPVAYVGICTYLRPSLYAVWGGFEKIFGPAPASVSSFKQCIPLILQIVFIAAILYCLYELFGFKYHFLMTAGVLGVGFVTRMAMGFSPTLYASDMRTFLFFDFAIIFACIWMVCKSDAVMKNKFFKSGVYLYLAVGCMNMVIDTVKAIGVLK